MNSGQAAMVVFERITSPVIDLTAGQALPQRIVDAMTNVNLSSGERVLAKAAMALWNGHTAMPLADLGWVSTDHQEVICCCWMLTYSRPSQWFAIQLETRLLQLGVTL